MFGDYQPGAQIPVDGPPAAPADQSQPRPSGSPGLVCPLCQNTGFQQEESRQESRWGWTSHTMTPLICTRCSYVLHFYGGRSFFNVD